MGSFADKIEVQFLGESKDAPKTIVRVKSSSWHDNKGVHFRRDMNILRRKSNCDYVIEDCSMIGAEEVIPRIINFHKVEDGVYELIFCNESRDWETGYVDDHDYKLVELNE